AATRKVWLSNIIRSKKEIDAVQSLRNWILAATLLSTVAVSLTVGVGSFVSTMIHIAPWMDDGNLGWKVFSIIVCYLGAFFCMTQAIRYFNHTIIAMNSKVDDSMWNMLEGIEMMRENALSIDDVGNLLNRGALFYTIGMRFYYVSFPAFIYLFGPIPLLGSSSFMTLALVFLD
ncbi:hypothetical protein EDD86DRAFT_179338, partial [Gorgonomyces haynaldii]